MKLDPAWLARQHASADLPPAAPRAPLRLAGHVGAVGSIEPALAQRIADAGLPLVADGGVWQVIGEPDAALARIARWLADQQLLGRWRDEPLAVCDEAGQRLAQVERAAVRRLGIASQAVHLVGLAAGDRVWVQQRALDKATDPGLWDTLVGGLVSAAEGDLLTLERETWEEAGLRLAHLFDLKAAGTFTIRRPVPEGYMVERIACWTAVVPEGMQPVNQDGEVERFDCVDRMALAQWLQRDAFTLEAALVSALALRD